MKIVLVGCSAVTTWPISPSGEDPRPWERDDRALHRALMDRGAEIDRASWDDTGIDWSRYDVALLRATWDYHHRVEDFLAWVDRVNLQTTLLNPAPVVRWNAHKRYLRDLDIPQPPALWWSRGQPPDWAALTACGWDQAFVKPAVGATAEGTLRFSTSAESLAKIEPHLRELLAHNDVIVQPYVRSVEGQGERSAIAIGGEITHFVRKMPNPGDWRVQDDYGGTDTLHEPGLAEQAFARRALDVLAARWGALPYARIDWLMHEQQPWLIEVELIEPCLFFRHSLRAAEQLAALVLARAT